MRFSSRTLFKRKPKPQITKFADDRTVRNVQTQVNNLFKEIDELVKDIDNVGFLTEEKDPVFLASPAADITEDDIKILRSLPKVGAVVVEDTANGKYYRIEVTNGVISLKDISDIE